MGARGPVTTLGRQIPVRLDPGLHAQLRILAAAEGTSVADFIRRLLAQSLEVRRINHQEKS